MSTGHWIVTFLDALSAELDIAENTALAYGRDLKDFNSFLSRLNLDFATAQRTHIEQYLVDLDHRGMARATRARKLAAVRQLFRFAFDEGWRPDNPAAQITGPGKAKSLPKSLSESDVDAILDTARRFGRNTSSRVRNACLCELLYATGMRVSELVALPVASARGNPQMLLIKGKGGKERMVPLSPPAQVALHDWLVLRDRAEDNNRQSGHSVSRFVFPSGGREGHLTRVWFYGLIKDIARAAGLDPKNVSPHTLRHAFATHLLANGADLRVIQTLLGHADISTTEIYTKVLDARLKDLVLNHHPLAGD